MASIGYFSLTGGYILWMNEILQQLVDALSHASLTKAHAQPIEAARVPWFQKQGFSKCVQLFLQGNHVKMLVK